MPRIIVIADTLRRANIDAPVLMDEEVQPVHLADEHASHQLIERMAWAVVDAQEVSTPCSALGQAGTRGTLAGQAVGMRKNGP